jgi:hypothetical protein
MTPPRPSPEGKGRGGVEFLLPLGGGWEGSSKTKPPAQRGRSCDFDLSPGPSPKGEGSLLSPKGKGRGGLGGNLLIYAFTVRLAGAFRSLRRVPPIISYCEESSP